MTTAPAPGLRADAARNHLRIMTAAATAFDAGWASERLHAAGRIVGSAQVQPGDGIFAAQAAAEAAAVIAAREADARRAVAEKAARHQKAEELRQLAGRSAPKPVV